MRVIVPIGCLTVLPAMALSCQSAQEKAQIAVTKDLEARARASMESMDVYRRAVALHESGETDEALELLRTAIDKYERNAFAWMRLGVLEFERNRMFEAAQAFSRTSELVPDQHQPYFNLGSVLEAAGKYDDAIRQYRIAMEKSSSNPEIMENLARCYLATDARISEARNLVENALRFEQRPEWVVWLQEQIQRIDSRTQARVEGRLSAGIGLREVKP